MKTEDNPSGPLLSGWRFALLIFIVLAAVVGYFLFTLWAGWDNVRDALQKVGARGILTTLCFSLFAYLMRFLRWQRFLHALGRYVPWPSSLRIYLSGFALTITPGKTGEMVRSVFLKEWGVPYRQSFGMFLSERVSDVLSVVLIASAGLWHYREARPVVIFFLFLTLGIIYFTSKTSWILSFENRLKSILPERFAHYPTFLLETIIAFKVCFEPKIMLPGIALGLLAWGAEGSACYFLLRLLGADITYYTTLFIYAFALLVGAITFLPGGLGGAEFTMAQLFLLNGVPPTTTVTVVLLIRLLTLWFSVLLGLAVIPKGTAKKV